MNKETNLLQRITTFLSRGLSIPAWVLAILVLAIPVASLLRIELSNTLLGLIVFILILVGLLMARYEPTQIEMSDPDAPPGHKIKLSRIPEYAKPELLPIPSRADLEDEKKFKRDGVGKILSITGNLIFRDSRKGKDKLVTSFSSPIRVTISYTEADENAALERQAALILASDLPEDGKVEIIPVYLYTYPNPDPDSTTDKPPEFTIWKPFQNFTRDEANRTLTVEVQFWGDQPIGGGTRP